MGLMFMIKAFPPCRWKGTWVQVQKLDVPNEGVMVWLRNLGYVKLGVSCIVLVEMTDIRLDGLRRHQAYH
jgi:hypothetical protein